MRVSDFLFDLPEALIAQHPPAERGSSRMLVLDRTTGHLTDQSFQSLPQLLQAGDLLILNDSRVLPARLFATRAGAADGHHSSQPTARIEVLLTEPIEAPDAGRSGETLWRALVRPARKVRPGEILHFFESPEAGQTAANPQPALIAEVLAAGDFGERTVCFSPVADFYHTLARIGHMPLPPYIHRDQSAQPDSAEDRERYQTVYSQRPGSPPPGSAAAPTAGLHFTPEMLHTLTDRGVQIAYLTLHVGLGTFQPVRVERVEDIHLHPERYTLPAATANALTLALAEGRRVIAVGTTSTRTLEHIAEQARIEPHTGSTSIFIRPGHRFRIVSGLLTNFHLPESTLLMLVAAFAAPRPGADSERAQQGRQTILAAYAHAIRQGYRFYSYGDCMLLL